MDKAPDSAALPTLHRRHKTVPDVPEDVALLHLNDPYFDLDSLETSTVSEEDFENEKKPRRFSGSSPTDVDGESQTDSRLDSRVPMHSADAFDYEDESPYAEVRAAVSNTDDPTMPVNTFRVWFLGILFSILISGLNQFFSLRYPTVYISGLVAQLLSLPAGKFMEHLPTTRIRTFGYTWSLNPGPFNIKEHTLITVMANVVSAGAYATDIIATQRIFFGQHFGLGYQIMLCLSSQMIGYAYAGFARRILVWPAAMIWPGALVNSALFNTLHRNYGIKERKHISREKFFLLAALGSFVWYWFPGYLFTALSVFNWVCWIAPNNVVVNQLFGYSTGLGMGFLTFDWTMISFVGSPLVVPWWAQVNTFGSFVFFYWFITPILYYTNTFNAKYLPMSAPLAFDNTGRPYQNKRVVGENGLFNTEAYREYSPLFLPITFAMSYGLAFASMTAVFSHTILWYRHDIARQLRRSLKDQRDVHSRLMSVYPEVPGWWYAVLWLISFALAIITIEVWDTKLPVWCLVLSLAVGLFFLLPIGMIQAITNQTVALQILAEFIVGYVLPGRPVAMMIFKTFCFISMHQALSFLGDLKLGHYMKIPPRLMFMSQVVATLISVVVVVMVQQWMFGNIVDLCHPDQPHHFTCPATSTFASAAMVWGGVGPKRMFSAGQPYFALMLFFLFGAILPIPFYFLARRYPLSVWRFINVPVWFAGLTNIPPATGINYSSWFTVGIIFQYYMRRYHFRWWMRYNYILSAALDSGVALALIVIFFGVQFPKGGFNLDWWGNTVWQNTADSLGAPFYTLAPNTTFGPKTWL